MPIDFEMILSASPPIFSGTPFMDFRYRNHFDTARHPFSPLSTAVHGVSYDQNGEARTCLAVRSEERGCNKNKRVWFADDKGLALTHVKIMSEPSNCPPRWTDDFFDHITRGIKTQPSSNVQWEAMFPQPASDYLEFRSKLQQNCVSLENVIIREGEDSFTGTIKVKNISFDKEVFVRVTFDKWHSSKDVPASYVPSGVDGGVTSPYDTFSFAVSIPQSAVKFETVEFCVCFRCNSSEHWDNNNGSNYKLAVFSKKSKPIDHITQFNDALKANFDSWSEFSSWSHLITDGPYW